VENQAHEQIEHAAHEAAHGGGLARGIGITIAILGVLLALCSAQLGASRTELISTMVEENTARGEHTAVANKYRNLQALLQQLHAAMPNLDFLAKKDKQLQALTGDVKDADAQRNIKATQIVSEKLLNSVIPTPDDVERFLVLLDRTREQAEAARRWSESYRDAVEAHHRKSERFEYALLSVEIGIVIASVGLLLSRQRRMAQAAWATAIVLGVVCLGIAGMTYVSSEHALHEAEQKIKMSEHRFTSMDKEMEDVAEDKKLEDDIRKELPAMRKLMAGP
jgi:hypothetical protein